MQNTSSRPNVVLERTVFAIVSVAYMQMQSWNRPVSVREMNGWLGSTGQAASSIYYSQVSQKGVPSYDPLATLDGGRLVTYQRKHKSAIEAIDSI